MHSSWRDIATPGASEIGVRLLMVWPVAREAELNETQFLVLVSPHIGSTQRHIARRVPVDDVDDVLQETLASAWGLLREEVGLESESIPRTLRHLASCRVADNWRARARHDRRKTAAEQLVRTSAGGNTDWEAADPEPTWIDGLPEQTQLVLRLLMDGMTVSEVAADLGVSANAVSCRLSRARGLLSTLRPTQPDPTGPGGLSIPPARP